MTNYNDKDKDKDKNNSSATKDTALKTLLEDANFETAQKQTAAALGEDKPVSII